MANVLNRITKEFRTSVNTPDFPSSEWIINPDLSAVGNFPAQYWTISGDAVLLMSLAERDAVDVALKAAATAKIVADATGAVTEGIKTDSPVKGSTIDERVRALEYKVYGG